MDIKFSKSDYSDGYWISLYEESRVEVGRIIPKYIPGNIRYLWHDGTIRDTATRIPKSKFEEGWYHSKQEAQEFLHSWLPKTKWITKKEVKKAAKGSKQDAILASAIHWRQIILNGINSYNRAGSNLVNLGSDYCALCTKYLKRGNCPLEKNCFGMCTGTYKQASNDICNNKLDGAILMHNELVMLYNKEKNMDNIDVKLEQNQADIDNLVKERERLLKEKEYKPMNGDVCTCQWGALRLILKINDKWWVLDECGQAMHQNKEDLSNVIKRNNYKKVGKLTEFKYE